MQYRLMKSVFAVVLAAGTSSRLGFNKLTVTIDGEPVIVRSVRSFIREDIEKVFVVTGHDHERIEGALATVPVTLIYNPDFRKGMSTSVRAAIRFSEGSDALLFHLGDKPLVTSESIAAVLKEYRDGTGKIVVPLHEGNKGHPVLIDAGLLRSEIEMVRGDWGLREVVAKHEQDMVFIKGDDGNLLDLDTVQAIDKLRARGFRIEESKH